MWARVHGSRHAELPTYSISGSKSPDNGVPLMAAFTAEEDNVRCSNHSIGLGWKLSVCNQWAYFQATIERIMLWGLYYLIPTALKRSRTRPIGYASPRLICFYSYFPFIFIDSYGQSVLYKSTKHDDSLCSLQKNKDTHRRTCFLHLPISIFLSAATLSKCKN